MNDLISRQAVIEALKIDCSWDIFDGYGNITEIGQNIIETINRVPSVQSEIIQCKDCKFSDEFEGDVWLCRRRKKSFRVSAIDTCNVAERKKDE